MDVDCINAALLKNKKKKKKSPIIGYKLTASYNFTIEYCEFPKILNTAIPLFQKGNKWNPDNQRRIPLLSVFSKICKEAVNQDWYCFLVT